MLTFPTSTPAAAAGRGVASSILGRVAGNPAADAGGNDPAFYWTGAAIPSAIRGPDLPA